MREHAFDIARDPFHPLRQRRHRAQHVHHVCPSRETFHMPGPGNAPETMTGASSPIGTPVWRGGFLRHCGHGQRGPVATRRPRHHPYVRRITALHGASRGGCGGDIGSPARVHWLDETTLKPGHGTSQTTTPGAGRALDSSSDWSGRPDLNRRPSAPQADALPGCATPREIAVLPDEAGGKYSRAAGRRPLELERRNGSTCAAGAGLLPAPSAPA